MSQVSQTIGNFQENYQHNSEAVNPVFAERIRIYILAAPIENPVRMSFSSLVDRRACVVEVEAGGVVGVGESWINYPSWAHIERVATIQEGVAPLVLGKDVSNPERTYEELVRKLLPVGRQWGGVGPIWQAISAVDMALWDLKGKLEKSPIHALIAKNECTGIRAYGSGVGPDNVEELCEKGLQQGLTAIKVKLGFGLEHDSQILASARSVVGPNVGLFADANQAWTLQEAVAALPTLKKYGVCWIEEPLAGGNLHELSALAEQSEIPIATGENLYGTGEFDTYIESGAIDFIQPDLAKCGGFTAAIAVARKARNNGVHLAPHCYGSAIGITASLHLAGAFSGTSWIELDVRDNPLRSNLLQEPLALRDGCLQVPKGHGLGVDLNAETMQKLRTQVVECYV